MRPARLPSWLAVMVIGYTGAQPVRRSVVTIAASDLARARVAGPGAHADSGPAQTSGHAGNSTMPAQPAPRTPKPAEKAPAKAPTRERQKR